MIVRNKIVHKSLVWFTAVTVAILFSARPVSGQFIIQPMKITLTPRQGQRLGTAIKLQNTGFDEVKSVDVFVADLTQAEDGIWQHIEPGSDFDISKLSSCRDWITLDSNSVDVPPMQSVPVLVMIKVPPGVRGFYGAAVIATLNAGLDVTGIAMVFKFVVPILVEIQGRPMRHKIELNDAGMEFREISAEKPASTVVTVGIVNNGGTYSRLKAEARVYGLSSGGDWRKVTETKFREIDIIPGVELKLKSDIERSLPSGKYKVVGALSVDGRRAKPFEKEIDFSGDPAVSRVAIDAALRLSPTEMLIDIVPGGTRTSVLKVHNASNETVNIRAILSLPPVLEGVAIGGVRGEDLYCADWVKVEPQQFQLRGGSQQNIRIITNMPNPGAMHANYYALLNMRATYTDGQNAGTTTACICLANKKVEGNTVVRPMKLTLGEIETSKYVIVGRFGNMGNVHLKPMCRAIVTTAEGRYVKTMLLSGDPGLMLPFEMRDFSTIFDFSGIAAGIYRLTATLEYAPGESVTAQIPIRVSSEGEQRNVQVIGTEEFEETIGVKWQ